MKTVWVATVVAAAGSSHAYVVHEIRKEVMRGRNSQRGMSTWVSDYLSETPMYSLRKSRRRFSVPRTLFQQIHDELVKHLSKMCRTLFGASETPGISSEVKLLDSSAFWVQVDDWKIWTTVPEWQRKYCPVNIYVILSGYNSTVRKERF